MKGEYEMRLAQMSETGTVLNIIVADTLLDGYIDVTDLPVATGDEYDGIDFITPVVVEPVNNNVYLNVVPDVERVPPNGVVTLTVTLDNKDGVTQDVNSEYLVPIIRDGDGLQTDLVSFQFVSGVCIIPVTFKEKGIYSINLEKIKPLPTAILENNIEIIVI